MQTTSPRRAPRRRSNPRSTLVLMVRHGLTPTTGQVLPGRAPGLHLADRGRDQAVTVAERLSRWSKPEPGKPGRIAAVYSSPLERTRETAAPIARALGLRVQVERGLMECDFGDWTGAELKKLMKLPEWSTVQRYPSGFQFPGGESFTGMQARIITTVAALCRRHLDEAIVVVSHADPIKAVVADALGSHLDLFQRIVVSPCSVTAIAYGATGPTVLTVNSTKDLTELVPS
ncbi:MAG: MSMEG_4193 family putative phosphomutase [Acidimicrobiales bacterium]|nr:MSMEG_4193 family putative phosphomutase [Acidimicrobiales bacterium]